MDIDMTALRALERDKDIPLAVLVKAMEEALLNAYENLILLCGEHHDEIDFQKNTFPREALLKWKREHEAWVFSRLQQIVPSIGFAELEDQG